VSTLSSFLSVDLPCDQTLGWLDKCLSGTGLRLIRTFDLQAARLGLEDCPCPHHGTSQCDCQMLVVLVYGGGEQPVTLMLHGNDGQTWLSLVNNPLQQADPAVSSAIMQALAGNPVVKGL